MRLVVCLILAALGAAEARAAAEPPRVRAARAAKGAAVRALFEQAHLAYPARELLLRGFKREGELEVWARSAEGPLTRLTTWRICARSGGPGPKRRAGDEQVPEGFYEISGLNPQSSYLLSLRVSYPNQSDKLLGARDPGGDIFIHGDCVTIGCLPIEDGPIQELYLIAQDARAGGARLSVHLFPQRLDAAGFSELATLARGKPGLLAFWSNLREGYQLFEQSHTVPGVSVDAAGRYRFKQ